MDNNEKSDIHSGITVAIIFAVAAIIMGVVAIANKYPRTEMSFDYLGLIVGILSLLVTALLGWNIYQVIDLRQAKKEIADIHNSTRVYIDHLHVDLYSTAVGVCKNVASDDNDKRHIKVLLVKKHLFLIYHELGQRNLDVAQASIESLLKELRKHNPILVTEHEMKTISAIESQVMNASVALQFEPGMQIHKIFDYLKMFKPTD